MTDEDVRAMGSMVTGRPRRRLDQALRYDGVVRFLRRQGTTRILEVGSGTSGLAAFWDGPVTGVDLRFDGTPLPNLTTVKGSAAELPFEDRAYEAVVCVDVFEHLSPPLRRRAFDELLRVAGRVAWLAFPAGAAAQHADDRIARLARSVGRDAPGWLQDHLQPGFPAADETLDWPSPGFTRGVRRSLSCAAHVGVVLVEHAPGGRIVDRLGGADWARRAILATPGPPYRLQQWLLRTGAGDDGQGAIR